MTWPVTETLHATCLAIGEAGVLIQGRSGSGKSDLALRLIDRGAILVSDDYAIVQKHEALLVASPPANIAGLIEIRGIGIVELPYRSEVVVAMVVTLETAIERMPPPGLARPILGLEVPMVHIAAFEASAPLKVEIALRKLVTP